MTYLEDYRKDPFSAEAYFHLVPHQEYIQSKGLVLVKADFLPYLTKLEAAELLTESLQFYLDDEKFKHVEKFNLESHNFNFEAAFNIKI
eukprot:CAMPEP_0184018224 /NCGR_PEP_ID=MMETSP0954-20121128/8019_1 /TAXON_ID=627963 /ORGANISM="Aplanochytrium sp, Strain PBS07" /LENGTH=88 /DNA_ID=CAMNT_0026299639 /DNA_START=513 /DNA_END=779 /DNA_ORIENTATION=-